MSNAMKRFLKVVLIIDALAFIAAMLVKRFVPERGDESSERFRIVCVTDGRQRSSTCDALEVGAVVTVMGGVELDLTGAHPAADGARLELITVMGGVEVTVPDDWSVQVEGLAVMGGNESRHGTAANGPRLSVHCTTVMGGVEVKRASRRSPVSHIHSGE